MGFYAYISVAFCLIGFLYVLKAFLFRKVKSSWLVLACFCFGVALMVPITWLIAADWDNPHVFRIAIWIGDPIGVLAVPCVSFLVDFLRGRRDMGQWQVRVPLEMLVLAPVWFYLWMWIQFLCLGWVWV